MREDTGEGRGVHARHIKRAGLLQDFQKLPSEVRKGDDTFGRVYGNRTYDLMEIGSKEVGSYYVYYLDIL